MTVAEYIDRLKAYPQDARVVTWNRMGYLVDAYSPDLHSVRLSDGYDNVVSINLIYDCEPVQPEWVVEKAVVI